MIGHTRETATPAILLKSVAKNAFEAIQGVLIGPAVDIALPVAERAQIIKPDQVIVMIVRSKNAGNVMHMRPQKLLPQIGRGVH